MDGTAATAKNRNTVTRILRLVFLLTSVSGIVATVIWIAEHSHSHLGAIHGKIGFLMAILAIIHATTHHHKASKPRPQIKKTKGNA